MSTFYSYKGIVRDKLYETPLASSAKPMTFSMVSNDYNPGDVVQNISPVPILFIHGTADRVIPYKHSRKLYAKAQEPKMIWLIEGGDHIEALSKYREEIIPKLQEFMLKCVE
jgi:pimeloyl-ACP methyl ester carboxylesterase